MVLNIVTLLFHGRASVSPRRTSSTRPSLPSSICGRSSFFFFFRQEVIRLVIFRKQHRFLFHEEVIVVVFSLLLRASCFLLTREKVKSGWQWLNEEEGKTCFKPAYPGFCNLHIWSGEDWESMSVFTKDTGHNAVSLTRGPVLERPGNFLSPQRQFYRVNLKLKADRCIRLKLLVWRKPLLILSHKSIKQLCYQ